MNPKKLLAWSAAVVASIGLAACGDSSEPEDAAPVSAAQLGSSADDSNETEAGDSTTSASTPTTPSSVVRTGPTNPTDLTVTVPEEEPEAAAFTVIAEGDGETVEDGDTAFLAWEMVEIATGDVVESTADDYGSPIPVALGFGAVPAALENAVIGQKVGTRLEVLFPAGMADLPEQFDATQAHVLAVEIVEIEEIAAPLPQTTTPASTEPADTQPADTDPPASEPDESSSSTQPTTTTPPAPADGLLVPAEGPLTVVSPAGSAFPTQNDWDWVTSGSGDPIQEGDTVQLEYVMVSWRTGDVVKSTAADFGGPQSIVLGQIEVPRFLESSIFQKPVGTRLQVVYAADLFDLPEGLDRTDAYVVAVDIVSRTAG